MKKWAYLTCTMAVPLILMVLAVFYLTYPCSASSGENREVETNTSIHDRQQDHHLKSNQATDQDGAGGDLARYASIYFYAFLEADQQLPSTAMFQKIQDLPVSQRVLNELSLNDRRFRPMAQFYSWASRPMRFLPAFLFVLFSTIVIWALFPISMSNAQGGLKDSFWKCFFTGLLICVVVLLFARAVFNTMIGWPLGIVSVAVFQFALLCGLAVVVSLLGHSICVKTKLNNLPVFATTKYWQRLLEFFIGTLVVALILQLGAIAGFPPAGIRLVCLLCVLGIGSIYRSRMAK